jgi:hypothetical protein
VAEIGLGLRYIALVHLLGHACLRTLQFVRAPTLLQDYRHLEDAIGGRLTRPGIVWARAAPGRARTWLYRFALERGYLDALLTDYIAVPFVRLFRWFDRLERKWTDFLSGRPSTGPDRPAAAATPGSGEEVPVPAASGERPARAAACGVAVGLPVNRIGLSPDPNPDPR